MAWIREIWRSAKTWPVIEPLHRLRLRRAYRSMPLVINLELTTRCNARCRMCPHPDLEFGKKEMSMDALERVLDGLAGVVGPGDILYPVGLGEPLLVPDLAEKNRRIAARFPEARIHYNTNGILLGSDRADAFLEHAHRVVVSLNAGDPGKYRELMGVDRYAQVTEGLRDFLARRARHARFRESGWPRVQVQMMGLDAYAADFARFEAEWRPLLGPGDGVHFNPMDNWGGRIAERGLYRRPAARRYPCGSPWRMVSVDVDGRVFPCCVPFGTRRGEDLELGNIHAQPLRDILRNGRRERIQALHLEGREEELESCRSCDVYRVDPNIRFRNPLSGRWV